MNDLSDTTTKNTTKTTFIYALYDPNTKMIRYIGKSNHPRIRYFHHIKDEHKTYKVNLKT